MALILLMIPQVLSKAYGYKVANELDIDEIINRLFKEFAQRPPATGEIFNDFILHSITDL